MKLPKNYVPGAGVKNATAFGGIGQRLMESMGWEKGQGLGKSKTGIKEAIEVKKKEDVLGVGANQTWNWTERFWENAYNSAVEAINHDADSSDSASSSDDDEPALSTATRHRDGTIATASAEELKIAKQLAKDPWGSPGPGATAGIARWGGKAGKLARIKQQEEEQAARARERLGLAAPSSRTAQQTSEPTSSASDFDAIDVNEKSASLSKAEKKKKAGHKRSRSKVEDTTDGSATPQIPAAANACEQQQNKDVPPLKKRIVIILQGKEENAMQRQTFKATCLEGWWGAKYFVPAGLLETLEEAGDADGASKERQTFNEDDQTALYMRVHEQQRQGRRGMGKSTTLKIAGGKWEGSKKMFDEDDDPTDGQAHAPSQTPNSTGNAAQQEEDQPQQQHGTPCVSAPTVKWIKVAKGLLKQAQGQRLKLSKLSKQLSAHAVEHAGLSISKSEVQELLSKKLARNKRLIVEGKFVSLQQ